MAKDEERRAYLREWAQKNPDKRRAANARAREKSRTIIAARCREYYANNVEKETSRKLKQKYGITLEEYNAKVAELSGRCECCGEIALPPKKGATRTLVIDHDHRTGRVRGFICQPCNTTIGLSKESTQRLKACAEYLDVQSIY